MLVHGWQRVVRATLVALALALTTASLVGPLPLPGATDGVSIAHAGVAADDKDKDKKDTKNRGDDGDEDHIARGQVIDINKLADPPELTLASADGDMLVRVLKTDEIDLNGVKLGKYLKLYGEKIHEQLFEAQMIEVEDD
jgi:hypothetical protein